MKMKLSIIILLPLLGPMADGVAQKTAMTVTCKAPPTPLGGDVEVECTFSERPLLHNPVLLYITKQHSKVQVYRESCGLGDQKKNCSLYLRPGFQTEGVLGRSLNIVKMKLQKEDLGLYYLQSTLFDAIEFNITTQPGKEDVTCSVPSVVKGQMMNVTCDFKEDMMKVKTRKGLIIQYYKDDTFSQSEEILDCYWTDSYQCIVYDKRFIHDPHISRYVTVSLPQADERAEGYYCCQEIGILDDDPRPCQFKLKESKGAQTKALDLLEESTEGPSHDERRAYTTMIIVVCLLTVIALAVVMVIYRRRTKNSCQNLFRGMWEKRGSRCQEEDQEATKGSMDTTSTEKMM